MLKNTLYIQSLSKIIVHFSKNLIQHFLLKTYAQNGTSAHVLKITLAVDVSEVVKNSASKISLKQNTTNKNNWQWKTRIYIT